MKIGCFAVLTFFLLSSVLVELRPNALIEIPLPNLLRQLCESLIGRARLPIQLDV